MEELRIFQSIELSPVALGLVVEIRHPSALNLIGGCSCVDINLSDLMDFAE